MSSSYFYLIFNYMCVLADGNNDNTMTNELYTPCPFPYPLLLIHSNNLILNSSINFISYYQLSYYIFNTFIIFSSHYIYYTS